MVFKMTSVVLILWFATLLDVNVFVDGRPSKSGRPAKRAVRLNEGPEFWQQEGQAAINNALNLAQNDNVAKNVILFIGAGMGVSTVTAARIMKGQLAGGSGEDSQLDFELFPYTSIVKTYNTDRQTPDSAGTATACLTGVKTRRRIIGIDANAVKEVCTSQPEDHVTSILDWSLAEGKSVGIVTTTRVTHPTPAATYAHVAYRGWESDSDMDGVTGDCKDIAYQLIKENPNIQVILGGGRRVFYPQNFIDPVTESTTGSHGRLDGLNLVEEWKAEKLGRHVSHEFVYDKGQFQQVNPDTTDYLLGLFDTSNMDYELDRDSSDSGQPSLSEMTEKAIKILSRNEKGFFLLVEGGRIDHGHHGNRAAYALTETIAMDKAVETSKTLISSDDTLMVVTGDHSHAFTIGGYPLRGNPILGLADTSDITGPGDGKPATTLTYANGPGFSAPREDVTNIDTADKRYRQQSAYPMSSATHSAEDVMVYALGPMAHLFQGAHEQTYIAHAMAYAACIGINKDHCPVTVTDEPIG